MHIKTVLIIISSFYLCCLAQNDKRVVIIGAGMSGLSAANEFLKNNFSNFIILEADNRIGGRVNTIQYGNYKIDIGAQYVTGFKNNPMYDLALELNELNNETADKDYIAKTNNGSILSDELLKELNKYLIKLIVKIVAEQKYLIRNNIKDPGLGVVFDRNYKNLIAKLKKENYQNIELFEQNYEVFVESINTLFTYYSSLNELGVHNEIINDDFSDENAVLKNGFSSIINHLYSKLPRNSVKLNQNVRNIDWSNKTGKIIIRTLNRATNKHETYEADSVLVTVSLGVMKNSHQSLFSPILPWYKIRSINRLGFGTVNKVFVKFEKSIASFLKGKSGLMLFWLSSPRLSFNFYKMRCFVWNKSVYESLRIFNFEQNKPDTLMIFTPGKYGISFEKYSDDCLVELFNNLFSQFPQFKDFPKVVDVKRSKWFSDPFHRGSYAYIKKGNTFQDVENYAKPIDKRIYFSGDSTTIDNLGYTHGAFITGRNASSIILEDLKSKF